MKKMSILCTAVFILSSSGQLFSQEKCEEKVMGSFQKNLWENSFFEGIRSEVTTQIAKEDDLFESLSPEIKIGITSNIDLEFQVHRSVTPNLDYPSSLIINNTDLFEYKLQNILRVELEGRAEPGIVFSEGIAGLNVNHTTSRQSHTQNESCDFFEQIINNQSVQAQEYLKALCKDRDKSSFVKKYERLINYFSKKTSSLLNKASDSDKNLLFAKDPFSPMKLHAKLGLPLDPSVFLDTNNEIMIGDTIDHTTYFSIKPLGVKFDIFGFIQPTYAKYRRFFKTITYKKEKDNHVLIEVEDTVIRGSDTEVFKITPRILKVIKLNLGKWNRQKFRHQSLKQRFKVNISTKQGREFFNKLVGSGYKTHPRHREESVLINVDSNNKDVKTFAPEYLNGYGLENKVVFTLPGLLRFEDRHNKKVDYIQSGSESYLFGNALFRKRLKNKIAIDLKLFELKEADRSYECNLEIASKKDSTLNFECSYSNRFSNNEIRNKVIESLEMTLNSELKQQHTKALASLDKDKNFDFSFNTNISFSQIEIAKILSHSEDEIFFEISKALFGKQATNVFATKFHNTWNKIKSDRFDRKLSKIVGFDKQCSSLLKNYNIINKNDSIYQKIAGTAGKNKGIKSLGKHSCYYYFNLAKDITSAILSLQEKTIQTEHVEKFLKVFKGIKHAGLVQNILVRLAGGVSTQGVRYSYVINSNSLSSPLISTNGPSYTTQTQPLLNLKANSFLPRINSIDFINSSCMKDKIKIKVEFNYPLELSDNLFLKLSMRNSKLFKDIPISNQNIKLLESHSIDTTQTLFELEVPLTENFNWKESHNAYLTLTNEDGLPLSSEAKTFIFKK